MHPLSTIHDGRPPGADARLHSGPREPTSPLDAPAIREGAHLRAGAQRSAGPLANQSAQVDPCASKGGAHVGAAAHGIRAPVLVGETGEQLVAGEHLGGRCARTSASHANHCSHAAPRGGVARSAPLSGTRWLQHVRWIDVHHIELRSAGGRHSLQNLVCICAAHHRAIHDGELTLQRNEAGALASATPTALTTATTCIPSASEFGPRSSPLCASLPCGLAWRLRISRLPLVLRRGRLWLARR